jgi:hypothetical protein
MKKQKKTKLYCGADEKTFHLFWRANNGNQKSVATIVKRGLFNGWLQWNHEMTTHMNVIMAMVDSGFKTDDPKWKQTENELIELIGHEPSAQLYANLMEQVHGSDVDLSKL